MNLNLTVTKLKTFPIRRLKKRQKALLKHGEEQGWTSSISKAWRRTRLAIFAYEEK